MGAIHLEKFEERPHHFLRILLQILEAADLNLVIGKECISPLEMRGIETRIQILKTPSQQPIFADLTPTPTPDSGEGFED